jgi:hypothetical protein
LYAFVVIIGQMLANFGKTFCIHILWKKSLYFYTHVKYIMLQYGEGYIDGTNGFVC